MSTTMNIYLDAELNEWQVQEIKAAIQEADNGEFATDATVADVFKKWGVSMS
jgi:RHH-type rel operon transcriptional repressor/antitoxin RelB